MSGLDVLKVGDLSLDAESARAPMEAFSADPAAQGLIELFHAMVEQSRAALKGLAGVAAQIRLLSLDAATATARAGEEASRIVALAEEVRRLDESPGSKGGG